MGGGGGGEECDGHRIQSPTTTGKRDFQKIAGYLNNRGPAQVTYLTTSPRRLLTGKIEAHRP